MLKLKRRVMRESLVKRPIIAEVALAGDKKSPLEKIEVSDNQSVANLIEGAANIEEKCSDFYVSNVKEQMELNGFSLVYYPDGTVSSGMRSPEMTRYAFSQLCTKIGVPAQYMQKCITLGRSDIAQYNMSEWLDMYDEDKGLFIREYDGKVRGILSKRYSGCDLSDVLSTADSILGLSDKFNVRGFYLSPERFHARFVAPDKLKVDGEDLYPGISIDSSDVGRATLMVRFIIWKQVCTNGLIVPSSTFQMFKQKHIGIQKDSFRLGLEKGFEKYESLVAIAEKQVQNTMGSGSLFDFFSDEEQVLEQIQKNASIPVESAEKVVSLIRDGRYDNNRWGYINALTEVAQDFTLERRIALEEYAGTLLVA